MSIGRIREAELWVNGTQKVGTSSVQWTDNDEFDRTAADDQFSGDPVRVSKAGSGSGEMLEGDITTGYLTSLVYKYKEVSVTDGVESETEKTVTFTKPTVKAGGSMTAGQAGRRNYTFDYATATVA